MHELTGGHVTPPRAPHPATLQAPALQRQVLGPHVTTRRVHAGAPSLWEQDSLPVGILFISTVPFVRLIST